MPAVGIVDADTPPTRERPSPAAPSTFTAPALVLRFCFEACLTRAMVASSVSRYENASQACAQRNRRASATCAINAKNFIEFPFIFMNEIEA
jgi:hypothetical protein